MPNTTQRKRKIALAAAGILLVPVPFVGSAVTGDGGKPVETAVVEPHVIRPSVLASGQLAHEEEVDLTSEVVGKVAEVRVREGQQVARGELVLVLDAEAHAAEVALHRAAVRLEEIDIARREARITVVERHHERTAALFERDLVDKHSFEAAADELALARIDLEATAERLLQARARLEQSEDQLAKTRVRAPLAGVVTALDIEAGETAIPSAANVPGSRLMTIADPSRVIAEVHVDEADIAEVRAGQEAEIVAVAHPKRPLAGIVEFVANTARARQNRSGLTFLVRIRIGSAAGIRPRPGMSCRAEIFTHPEEAVLAVPIQAVLSRPVPGTDPRQFVFVARGGTAHRVAVATGRSDDAWQELAAGVEAGERVVTGPGRTLRRLRDGDAVRALEADGSRPAPDATMEDA